MQICKPRSLPFNAKRTQAQSPNTKQWTNGQPGTQRRGAIARSFRRSRPSAGSGTHLTLAADHMPTPNPQTITTTPAATGEEIANSGTTEPQQPQQPSSHAAASNQSASPPAGPSGLGQVVGTNCDPKCK